MNYLGLHIVLKGLTPSYIVLSSTRLNRICLYASILISSCFKYLSHIISQNQELKGLIKKGEAILQIGAICRKLETEREKVMPFGSKPKEMFQQVDANMRKPPEDFKEVR